MQRAKEHAQKLSEVGLDFSNLVGKDLDEIAAESEGPVGLGLAKK